MSKLVGRSIVAVSIAMIVVGIWRSNASPAANYESELRMLEDRYAAAIRAKDIDKLMACYMNSEKLVVFDLIPPRQYTGWDAYKANWQGFLGSCKDNPTWEVSDLHFMGGQGYAFGHSIQHVSCTNQQGAKMDLILRVTDGYANFKGQWLIAHEHISVPVDLATDKGDLQSKP